MQGARTHIVGARHYRAQGTAVLCPYTILIAAGPRVRALCFTHKY